MPTSTSFTWLLGPILVPFLILSSAAKSFTPVVRENRIVLPAAFLSVYFLAVFWLNLVTTIVPEPYLDEIFHIPQAQAYCAGKYDVWDPKLTTPPGLYVFANILSKLKIGACDVLGLRLASALILAVITILALKCRSLVTDASSSLPAKRKVVSLETVHTAINIALFPPLFFFSALFYTDILSTCAVLATYKLLLQRKDGRENSLASSAIIYGYGICALAMRQTNIFWVAIFCGGLDAVHAIKKRAASMPLQETVAYTLKDRILSELRSYCQGNIHDIPLRDAGVHDFIMCAISIALTIISSPIFILNHLWPYIALLGSFGAFVFWNGGVVLGDKSNHVATIHLPQLFYLMVFTTFFSVPLIIPPVIRFLRSLLSLLKLPLFPRLTWKYGFAATYSAGAFVFALAVIKYNTIIHPFTLADNRHYVFYIFRYSILRHPLIRYLLAPIYLLCGYAVFLTLCSPPPTRPENSKFSPPTSKGRPRKVPETIASIERKKAKGNAAEPTTSFLLILLISTALSLITAPLVEPRYFIIPWVIWRLHVPSICANNPAAKPKDAVGAGQKTQVWLRSYDYRLFGETLWFLVINAVTGYIFLYRGFSWPQEPGKVQRFMW